jgi:hypothetical protein
MDGPFKSFDTVLVPGIGVAIVERELPSGARLVRDCLGLLWLVAKGGHHAEKAPDGLFARLRGKDGKVAKRVGPARKSRR